MIREGLIFFFNEMTLIMTSPTSYQPLLGYPVVFACLFSIMSVHGYVSPWSILERQAPVRDRVVHQARDLVGYVMHAD